MPSVLLLCFTGAKTCFAFSIGEINFSGTLLFSRTIDTVKSWEAPFPLYSSQEILAAIGYDDAILNIHPELLADPQQQDVILEVIKRLKERANLEFVTLKQYYSEIDPTSGRYWQPGSTLKQIPKTQQLGSVALFLLLIVIGISIF